MYVGVKKIELLESIYRKVKQQPDFDKKLLDDFRDLLGVFRKEQIIEQERKDVITLKRYYNIRIAKLEKDLDNIITEAYDSIEETVLDLESTRKNFIECYKNNQCIPCSADIDVYYRINMEKVLKKIVKAINNKR